jgi:penicillin amidase
MDQFPAWLNGTTFPLPFTPAAAQASTTHTLTLVPAP